MKEESEAKQKANRLLKAVGLSGPLESVANLEQSPVVTPPKRKPKKAKKVKKKKLGIIVPQDGVGAVQVHLPVVEKEIVPLPPPVPEKFAPQLRATRPSACGYINESLQCIGCGVPEAAIRAMHCVAVHGKAAISDKFKDSKITSPFL